MQVVTAAEGSVRRATKNYRADEEKHAEITPSPVYHMNLHVPLYVLNEGPLVDIQSD